MVAVAHGLHHPSYQRTVRALVDRLDARLPEVRVRLAWTGVARPSIGEVLNEAAEEPGDVVVLPLRLSSGRHVLELPGQVRGHPVAPTLGPDRLLATVMRQRLLAAGARPGQPVVMVAAGSSEPAACGDTLRASRLLQEVWGGPVRPAHLTGRGPSVAEAAAGLRAVGHPPAAVASYLLGPSLFVGRARDAARCQGIGVVADVLGDHPWVAELAVRRFRTPLARQFALSLS